MALEEEHRNGPAQRGEEPLSSPSYAMPDFSSCRFAHWDDRALGPGAWVSARRKRRYGRGVLATAAASSATHAATGAA